MSVTASSPAIKNKTVLSEEKGSSEQKQINSARQFLNEISEEDIKKIDTEAVLKEIMASEEFQETKLKVNNSETKETKSEDENTNNKKLKDFFKTIKPLIQTTQYGITAGSILLHSGAFTTLVAKGIQSLTGVNPFGLADKEKMLNKDATWFCRFIDPLPTVLSGIENMLENSTFSLGLARVSTSMQMLFPNIANKTFGGGIALAHNSQKFLNDRALKAGFIDKLDKASENTKSAHFSTFLKNSGNVFKASLENLKNGEKIYHSFANIAIAPLALLGFCLGVPFCRDNKLGTVPKKILRSMKAASFVLFSALMIKLGKEEKKTDSETKATNFVDTKLSEMGIVENVVGGLTGWVEDYDYLLQLKNHFCYTLRPIINLGWNNRDKLINMISKKFDNQNNN